MHVIGSRASGGAERFYARLCLALHEQGHKVSAVNQPNSAVASMLANVADPTPVCQAHIRMRNVADFLAMFQIRRAAKQFNPEVVQTYMGRATRLSRFSRADVVHVARLGGFYNVKGYRHVDAWVGNTKGICDHLVANGCAHERVFHIGNFVNAPGCEVQSTEAFQTTRERLGIQPDTLVIFSAGRLIARKGFADLVEALAELPREVAGRQWHCIIAGEGIEREQLSRLTQQHRLEGHISWIGWVEQLAPYYQGADLFVCPSRWEPLGNVILEGWQHRTPVISTASQGALELITDTENGLLCRPEDPRALSEAMLRALELSASDLARLTANGYQTLMASHSVERVTAAYLEMYQTLLAGRR